MMSLTVTLTTFLLALVLSTIAFPAPHTHTVHERRVRRHARWTNPLRIRSESTVQVRVGLKQSNLHYGHDFLMDVSDPDSKNYGKFWTEEEVIQTFAPSYDSVNTVKDWLIDSGIHDSRITHSENKLWLAFVATGEELEKLLHANFYQYEDSETGDTAVSTERYHVPKHITKHIDYITPGIRFPFLQKRGDALRQPLRIPTPPHIQAIIGANDTSCADAITPDCIAQLYQIPPVVIPPWPENTLGIFEEGDQYNQTDLDSYWSTYPSYGIPNGTHPLLASIDGGQSPGRMVFGESNLDFSLAFPIIYPQNITLFQTDDQHSAAFGRGLFNTFLDAIDGSYCTSCYAGECGNADIDPVYPDSHGGYQGKLMCGTYRPTNVISISYGASEDYVPRAYYERQCHEFMKLGLRGVSIFLASGDSGVASRSGCLGNSSTIFNPDWPASCPYVTAVGATKIPPGGSVSEGEVVANDPAGHPYFNAFASGGGFSNIFGIPDYQAEAVASYFANHNPPYASYNAGILGENGGLYNRSGRGYPDISAVGDNIPIWVGGRSVIEGGTSASAPIVASIINRIIEERNALDKPGPLGFLNPVFYRNPEAFNDITNGTNSGCKTEGFSAVPGWDPASGLGTPNYPKLREILLAL